MRPLPTPLPLLRLVSISMALLALFFAGHLLWQERVSKLTVEDRFSDILLQDRLTAGLQVLRDSLRPGQSVEVHAVCPAKTGQEAAKSILPQLACARGALNVTLANASVPHHISQDFIEDEFQAHLLNAMQWLLRNAGDGNHALTLLRNPYQTARQNSSRSDPFRLSGCLYAKSESPQTSDVASDCPKGVVVTDADLPPHSESLFVPVHRYRAATRGASPNTNSVELAPGLITPLFQGRNVTVALSAQVQSQAQTTASCYAGVENACSECTWCNSARASSMFEGARARAIGILVVDVKTGAIEAAASAYTPCYVAQHKGEQTPAGCPVFPSMAVRKRSGSIFRLGNQALLQTAQPGSQVKLPIAMGLMQAGLSSREMAALPSILTRSATEELIDIVFCKEKDFLPACAHRRLSSIQKAALNMGWISHTDVLAVDQIEALNSYQFAGRLMQLPPGQGQNGEIPVLDQASLRACGLKPVAERWRNCRGANLVNVVAELFGQGNSLASPIGIANGLLQLAAAGNRVAFANSAHLLSSAQDNLGAISKVQKILPLAFKPGDTVPVLLGLSRTHSQGTAHSACLAASAAVNGAHWAIACSTKEASDDSLSNLRIASKTGTPGFAADKLTLPQWRASCTRLANEFASIGKGQRWYYLQNELAKCGQSPVKWYSIVVGQPGTQTFDKVLVVLAERNWYRNSLRVDSALDRIDPNVAAEVGLALANRLYAPSDTITQAITLSVKPQKGQL